MLPYFRSRTDPISLFILLLFFFLLLLGDHLQKSLRLRCFKSDNDEIWQDCSSSKYASTDGVGFLIRRIGHAAASAGCPPSACDVIGSLYELQFLIHSTFVLVTSVSCVRQYSLSFKRMVDCLSVGYLSYISSSCYRRCAAEITRKLVCLKTKVSSTLATIDAENGESPVWARLKAAFTISH